MLGLRSHRGQRHDAHAQVDADERLDGSDAFRFHGDLGLNTHARKYSSINARVKSTYETVVPVHDLKYLVGDRMAIFYGSFQAAFEAFCAGDLATYRSILNF